MEARRSEIEAVSCSTFGNDARLAARLEQLLSGETPETLGEENEVMTKRFQIEGGDLDAVDAAILRELWTDARIGRAELARRVSLSAPSVGERIRKLEEA